VVRGLLGVLLLAGGRPLTTERLIELVWADRAERTGRGPVQAAVSRLRDWLGRLPGDAPPVEYDSGGYRLALPAETVDAGRFRALVLRAAAADDPAARCELLDTALTPRRGPALAGLVSADRADPLVRETEDAVRRAAVAFAEAAMAVARPGSTLPRLAVLAGEHPLDEELQAVLIELLSADGRPADALRHYQKVRDRITDELGVEPGARVRRAYLMVLARDRDHGPGPLVETTMPPPAQLPPDHLADFTGRDADAGLLTRTLAGTGAPVVTAISGPGGVGKTVLAVHVAHRLAARFPGGQLYADLGAELGEPADPARVLGGFLAALGIAGPAVPEALEERTALFRSLPDLDLDAGRFASATLRLEESVLVWRSRGWSSFLAATLRSLGHAHAGTGESAAAAKAWAEARTLFEELSDPAAVAEITALLEDARAAPPRR
jgi:DNA-binding SARP family transcriptional activator